MYIYMYVLTQQDVDTVFGRTAEPSATV